MNETVFKWALGLALPALGGTWLYWQVQQDKETNTIVMEILEDEKFRAEVLKDVYGRIGSLEEQIKANTNRFDRLEARIGHQERKGAKKEGNKTYVGALDD